MIFAFGRNSICRSRDAGKLFQIAAFSVRLGDGRQLDKQISTVHQTAARAKINCKL